MGGKEGGKEEERVRVCVRERERERMCVRVRESEREVNHQD